MTTTNVLHATEFDGYGIDRIEVIYPSGQVVKMWRTRVPHPDVRTQSWVNRTKAEALGAGEWLKPGGGRDQATVSSALKGEEISLEAVVNSEVLSALYNEMSN
jgi:hypothetical protein